MLNKHSHAIEAGRKAVDLAVGVIIGSAFGKIVRSFVCDVIMPPIGVLLGGVDFSTLGLTIKEAMGATPAAGN